MFQQNLLEKAQTNRSAVLVELETAVGEKRVACVVGGISGGNAVSFWRRGSLVRKKRIDKGAHEPKAQTAG